MMCHADTSLMTFRWDKAHQQPMLNLEGPQHVCSDWDALGVKMKPRVVADEEMRRLVNPDSIE